MGKIASNLNAANSSITSLQRVSEEKFGNFSLSSSNLKGMETGVKVSNKLLDNINKLTSSVKKQADKFPQIAKIIEARDNDQASKFGE
ncbi:hypothetical protein ESZ50_10970 [Weissella muntiaci]|uniref:TIGR04197 family type VII secretion effector n=1 Tax=Weissella muntiaci TaxID=2508881 RepID=A0A6C2C1K1_9LACO|nr:hypothetical protein [Weissella muntiaci]TYC47868.1 hypothetical protein ESZ50_10970 [Weissella muntiaci]